MLNNSERKFGNAAVREMLDKQIARALWDWSAEKLGVLDEWRAPPFIEPSSDAELFDALLEALSVSDISYDMLSGRQGGIVRHFIKARHA